MIRIRAELVSEARRADRSLTDLLSVGDIVRVTATTSNRRRRLAADRAGGGHDDSDEDEVMLAQPATLTVSSPAPPAAATDSVTGHGRLNVLTYRDGRVDAGAVCTPCAYDYSVSRRRLDIRVWQLSGIGYVSCSR